MISVIDPVTLKESCETLVFVSCKLHSSDWVPPIYTVNFPGSRIKFPSSFIITICHGVTVKSTSFTSSSFNDIFFIPFNDHLGRSTDVFTYLRYSWTVSSALRNPMFLTFTEQYIFSSVPISCLDKIRSEYSNLV